MYDDFLNQFEAKTSNHYQIVCFFLIFFTLNSLIIKCVKLDFSGLKKADF